MLNLFVKGTELSWKRIGVPIGGGLGGAGGGALAPPPPTFFADGIFFYMRTPGIPNQKSQADADM